MTTVSLPLETQPKVVHAWRSVHEGPSRQAFVVDGLWGVHLYRYGADVRLDGTRYRIEPGHAGFTPPGARMEYHFAATSSHVFAHIAWPTAPATHHLPLLFATGGRFESLWARLEQVVPWRGTARADVRVWDILLELAEIAAAPGAERPAALESALRYVEANLSEPIGAADVAAAVNLSHNHLCRLFRVHLGETVMGAIRHRRVERARHLLLYTTLSVKEVAHQVGIDDLQRFNKTMRLETGRSPSALRSGR